MQLSFEAQSREDGTTKKTKTVLRSVELPHLHIFSPDAVATLGDKATAVRLTGREVWRAHEDVLKVSDSTPLATHIYTPCPSGW